MTGGANKWVVGQSVWICESVQNGATWYHPAKIVEIDESGIIKAETTKEPKTCQIFDNCGETLNGKQAGFSDHWLERRHE